MPISGSVLRIQLTCVFNFFVTTCSITPRPKKFVEGRVRILNSSRHPNSVRNVRSHKHGTIPVLASSNGSPTSTRKDDSTVPEPSTVFKEENANGDATDSPMVGIIMESDSDLLVMIDAARTLSDFGVPYEIEILSPHQNRKEALSYALSAKERGIKIIIVGDGVEAHLSGVAAANSQVLVIRVPLLSEELSEDDVINSIQMRSHVQVASVPRNNAKNAALCAVKVLGIADEDLLERIRKYMEE